MALTPVERLWIGTSLTTSQDAPALHCAYKIQEYDGQPKRKRSEGKATWAQAGVPPLRRGRPWPATC